MEQAAFEVLLVDNGSSDFAPPATLPKNVRVFQCHTPGSYAARNYAATHAQGEWLIFTDADCLPTENWLQSLMTRVELLSDTNVLLAGAIQMRPRNSSPTIFEMYDLVKGIPQAWYVSRGYAVTANLAISADLFIELGGFDHSRYSGGDAEFSRRAVQGGVILHYVEQAVVEHPARDTWSAVALKARRVKGGQLTSGTSRQRKAWLIKTFTPPLFAFVRFLKARNYPFKYRMAAVMVQLGIWLVELQEAYRLILAGKKAERR